MSIIPFIKSKFFLKQLGIALGAFFVLVFILMQWLSHTTHHGEEIEVPNLEMMTLEEAKTQLEKLELEYVILDTIEFRKNFPPFSIVEQEPLAKEKVKTGRKIYLKLNSNSFAMVAIPNLVEKTYRQAIPTLNSIGLEVGSITYKPYLAKDMVLEMTFKGKKVQPGQKVPKTSKIDLVLGDGSISFEEIEETEMINEE